MLIKIWFCDNTTGCYFISSQSEYETTFFTSNGNCIEGICKIQKLATRYS